jgi:hypothetical protein
MQYAIIKRKEPFLSSLTIILIFLLNSTLFSTEHHNTDLQIHDIGVTRILSPPEGGIPLGSYDFTARIQNLGDYMESFVVVANIYDTVPWSLIFTAVDTINNFSTGADTALQFAPNIFVIPMNYYLGEVIILISDDNPSNDTAYTNYFIPESLGQHIYSIDAQTPTASMALHGVEFDGTYFYLTGITAIDSCKIFVLDTLGNLIWTIDQPAHCTGWGWRDMAFDRVYVGPDRIDTLYASCNADVDRFGINKITGTLDYYGPLPGPINPNRPLAYMPESLYFFTADMFYLYKFIKNGSFVNLDTTIWVMRGAAYDSDTLGNGFVWWSSLDTTEQFKLYDPNVMNFTGTAFGADYPGSGLGFAQNFRDMDVLFSVMNVPQEDYIYGFFLRWSDSTKVMETPPAVGQEYMEIRTPNPIRKGARICFVLPSSDPKRLQIYNAMGRCVRTIGRDLLTTDNVFLWDGKDCSGRNLPSGVYFYKLEALQEIVVGKIVYIE